MHRIPMAIAVGFSALALAVAGWTAIGPVQGAGSAPPLPSAPSPALVVSGGCTIDKVKYKISNSFVSTTSSSFVDVTDMVLSFTVSGIGTTCVEVEFSAAVASAAGEIMELQALLDGTPQLGSYVWGFAGGNTWGAHAFHFAFKDVAPGAHTVKIRYASEGGAVVWMYHRSLFVHYR